MPGDSTFLYYAIYVDIEKNKENAGIYEPNKTCIQCTLRSANEV